MGNTLQCGRFELSLKRPLVMGIVNVTPDSFSDGRPDFSPQRAIRHGLELAAQGAHMLDIGGESSRPGAAPVSVDEELARVIPVIEGLRDTGIPLSVDTTKPAVMRQALDAGADMINDITGFQDAQAIEAVRHSDCALCVMHMQGEPRTMQLEPTYDNVVIDIRDYLRDRASALGDAGVSSNRIVLDPGLGFGKTVAQNYELLKRLSELSSNAMPILLGVSRKSMIGHVVDRPADQRLAGSLAAMLAGISQGANIVRVHDVQQTVDAIRVWQAVEYGIQS